MKKLILILFIFSTTNVIAEDDSWNLLYTHQHISHSARIVMEYYNLTTGITEALLYVDNNETPLPFVCKYSYQIGNICSNKNNEKNIYLAFVFKTSGEYITEGAYAEGRADDPDAVALDLFFNNNLTGSKYHAGAKYYPANYDASTGMLHLHSVRYENKNYDAVLVQNEDGSFTLTQATETHNLNSESYDGTYVGIYNLQNSGLSYQWILEYSNGLFWINSITSN